MAGQKIHSCAEVEGKVEVLRSIDSQTNVMDHNASNNIIDSQLNSKDNDDDNDDDDDDDWILNIRNWYVLLSRFFLSFNSYD